MSQIILQITLQTLQNYPIPFNLAITIRFHIASVSYIRLTLYDKLKYEIETPANP